MNKQKFLLIIGILFGLIAVVIYVLRIYNDNIFTASDIVITLADFFLMGTFFIATILAQYHEKNQGNYLLVILPLGFSVAFFLLSNAPFFLAITISPVFILAALIALSIFTAAMLFLLIMRFKYPERFLPAKPKAN